MTGTHGTPEGVLIQENGFFTMDAGELAGRTGSGWVASDVFNPSPNTPDNPIVTFLCWCFSSALTHK